MHLLFVFTLRLVFIFIYFFLGGGGRCFGACFFPFLGALRGGSGSGRIHAPRSELLEVSDHEFRVRCLGAGILSPTKSGSLIEVLEVLTSWESIFCADQDLAAKENLACASQNGGILCAKMFTCGCTCGLNELLK